MGMYLGLYTLSDANIEKVFANPILIWKVLGVEPEETPPEPPRGPLSWFRGKKSPAAPATELDLGDAEAKHMDLDKAWHGIHYLLTGTLEGGDAPLNFITSGGTEVGDVDVGYGPARAMTAKEVKALNAALQPIDEAALRNRFNPSEMMMIGIYPGIWDRDQAEDDSLGYLLEYFDELKTFISEAADQNMGVIMEVS